MAQNGAENRNPQLASIHTFIVYYMCNRRKVRPLATTRSTVEVVLSRRYMHHNSVSPGIRMSHVEQIYKPNAAAIEDPDA
jgi:hypothetical protein